MTVKEQKKLLRSRLLAREKELSEAYIEASDRAIAKKVFELSDYKNAETIFCFVSFGREVDTKKIITAALKEGKRVCVPLCESFGTMSLHFIKSLDDLSPGAYGILEPSAELPKAEARGIDFALIPCLSCDEKGSRLGRGGGYYDRFLSKYRASAAMLCRKHMMCDDIPKEAHDIDIAKVITE